MPSILRRGGLHRVVGTFTECRGAANQRADTEVECRCFQRRTGTLPSTGKGTGKGSHARLYMEPPVGLEPTTSSIPRKFSAN